MKAKDIIPGERYAVRARFHGKVIAVEHVTAVEHSGNAVVCLVRRRVQTNHDLSSVKVNAKDRTYVERDVTILVPGADVICLSEDYPKWVAHQSDGRLDRPKMSIVAGGHVVFQDAAPLERPQPLRNPLSRMPAPASR